MTVRRVARPISKSCRSPDNSVGDRIDAFSYFPTKTYVVGTQKNRLNETGSSEQPKHMFKLIDKKMPIGVYPMIDTISFSYSHKI